MADTQHTPGSYDDPDTQERADEARITLMEEAIAKARGEVTHEN